MPRQPGMPAAAGLRGGGSGRARRRGRLGRFGRLGGAAVGAAAGAGAQATSASRALMSTADQRARLLRDRRRSRLRERDVPRTSMWTPPTRHVPPASSPADLLDSDWLSLQTGAVRKGRPIPAPFHAPGAFLPRPDPSQLCAPVAATDAADTVVQVVDSGQDHSVSMIATNARCVMRRAIQRSPRRCRAGAYSAAAHASSGAPPQKSPHPSPYDGEGWGRGSVPTPGGRRPTSASSP